MKEFSLQDTLRVSDSKIKGFVVMEREDGTTVFAKPNMIVKNGRNFIKDLVYNQVATTNMDERKFSSIGFGSGITPTSPTDTDLESAIADLNETNAISSDTDLIWSEVTTTYSYGTVLPDTATFDTDSGIGELFVKTDDVGLYTATAPNT
jgi:hypothetical protein